MKRTTSFVSYKRLLTVMLLSSITVSASEFSALETTASASDIASPASEVKPGRWVVIGSSTAAGTGAPRKKGWVALVASEFESYGAQVMNLAKGGAVTYRGLSTNALQVARRPRPDSARNIDSALALLPVLLIISYPTNDTAIGYSIEETVDNVLSMRAQAQALGVAVIVTSTQPRNLSETKLAKLRAIDDRLASSIGPCFVGVRQALAGTDGRLALMYDWGDGVHPSSAGHAVIAEAVIETIKLERCVRVTND